MMTFNCIYKNTETFKKDFTNNNNTLLKLLKFYFQIYILLTNFNYFYIIFIMILEFLSEYSISYLII